MTSPCLHTSTLPVSDLVVPSAREAFAPPLTRGITVRYSNKFTCTEKASSLASHMQGYSGPAWQCPRCCCRLQQDRHRQTRSLPFRCHQSNFNKTPLMSFTEKETKAFASLCKRGTVLMLLLPSSSLGFFGHPLSAALQPHAPAQALF